MVTVCIPGPMEEFSKANGKMENSMAPDNSLILKAKPNEAFGKKVIEADGWRTKISAAFRMTIWRVLNRMVTSK